MCLSLGLCAGCKAPEKNEVTPTTEAAGPVIGLSFDSFVIERWTRDRDVFVSAANELGAEVNVQSAGGDVDVQISHIKHFIDIGVDAIVIITADAVRLADILKEAKNKGIPVICYDRLVMNCNAEKRWQMPFAARFLTAARSLRSWDLNQTTTFPRSWPALTVSARNTT